MKKLFIGICEHSSEDLKYLIQHLEVGQDSLDVNFEIFTYTTGSDFLNCYRPIFDIIFLSIPRPSPLFPAVRVCISNSTP